MKTMRHRSFPYLLPGVTAFSISTILTMLLGLLIGAAIESALLAAVAALIATFIAFRHVERVVWGPTGLRKLREKELTIS